jgi:hypothetical protein
MCDLGVSEKTTSRWHECERVGLKRRRYAAMCGCGCGGNAEVHNIMRSPDSSSINEAANEVLHTIPSLRNRVVRQFPQDQRKTYKSEVTFKKYYYTRRSATFRQPRKEPVYVE